MRKNGGARKTGPARPPRQGGSAGPVRPAQVGPGGGWFRFLPELLLFDFLLRSENFKGSLNKENEVPRLSSSDYLLAELGARESIPSSNILHPHSSHCVPEELRVKARRQGALDGGGEAMRAQATRRDQEDRSHPLWRACPNRSYRISQLRREGERPYYRLKVGAHPRHEAEGLQGGVARA
jgi:hypothetical protein